MENKINSLIEAWKLGELNDEDLCINMLEAHKFPNMWGHQDLPKEVQTEEKIKEYFELWIKLRLVQSKGNPYKITIPDMNYKDRKLWDLSSQ